MLLEIDHLKKANANYFKHGAIAIPYSFLGLAVFIMGVVHAIFPFMFGFTPYRLAKKITDGTEKNFPACIIEKDTNNK